MPYQVQQLIEGKGNPVCVVKEDTVVKALATMIEHDYSQLPVIIIDDIFEIPIGMITYEGILRGIRNFRANIEDLRVRDVMVSAPIFSLEDDLFDILDRLKETNAVLIQSGYEPNIVGIVTSYDTTEYFRNRTEDLMRVEDIELMVKEFIKLAYLDPSGEVDISKLNAAANDIANAGRNENNPKEKTFDDLTMADYIGLLLCKENWHIFEPVFCVQRTFIIELLNGVRDIRNALSHFRGDLTSEQRDRLKFATEWLSRCQEEYEKQKEQEKYESYRNNDSEEFTELITSTAILDSNDFSTESSSTDFAVTEATLGGGRYAALADWLQSQPGRIGSIQLTFNQIEEIINYDLPVSARNHRAWWANDSVGHTQSQLWLDAGWRTTSINLGDGKITFSRIREREKAYISFFSKLLDDFKKKIKFPIRDVSPDGVSWIVIQGIPRTGASFGSFNFSFTRDRKLRVELYLDLGDQTQTKAVFDKLYDQKDFFEETIGDIGWERLDNRRASRIALYREGSITEEKGHTELRKWAVETMTNFYKVFVEPAEKAIIEIKTNAK